MYCIKSRDLTETIPESFPHPELISGRWEAWPVVGTTFEKCFEMVEKQIKSVPLRPQPAREYRIFRKDEKKLTLLWEGRKG